MKQIRNKNDLLAWLENNAPRKAIANTMLEGKVELLGFFNPIFAGSNPGWIVRVTSKRGLSWNVVIVISKYSIEYFLYTIKEIPWENYVGGDTPLFAGDNPISYQCLRTATIKTKEVQDGKRNERPN